MPFIPLGEIYLIGLNLKCRANEIKRPLVKWTETMNKSQTYDIKAVL